MMELKITSMTPADRLYAYNQSSQLEGQTGCIGHLRGDFGCGQEFYTSWFDHRREYKTDEFMEKYNETYGTHYDCGDVDLDTEELSGKTVCLGKFPLRNRGEAR